MARCWEELTAEKQRTRELEALLRKVLDSGAWFCSALELEMDVDGEELADEIRIALHLPPKLQP